MKPRSHLPASNSHLPSVPASEPLHAPTLRRSHALSPAVLRATWTLLSRLNAASPPNPPHILLVFELYCVKNLSVRQVARHCHCSLATVSDRLSRIHALTGIHPKYLKNTDPNAFRPSNSS